MSPRSRTQIAGSGVTSLPQPRSHKEAFYFRNICFSLPFLPKQLLSNSTEIEPLNLVFAINANGQDAKDNFDRMTNTITSIIDSYGQGNINYGLIVYGGTAVSRIQLTESFTDDELLKTYVKMVQQVRGGADLPSALENSKDLFSGDIPKRRNVLVIMTDSEATGDKAKMQPTADELHDMGVKVITVAMGTESDQSELRPLSPKKDNSLKEDPKESPKQLGDRIMKEAVKGRFYVFFVSLSDIKDLGKGFNVLKSSARCIEKKKNGVECVRAICFHYCLSITW